MHFGDWRGWSFVGLTLLLMFIAVVFGWRQITVLTSLPTDDGPTRIAAIRVIAVP